MSGAVVVGRLSSVKTSVVNSLASSTWTQYNAAWSSRCSFLNSVHLPIHSFSELFVLSFLDALVSRFYSYSHLVKNLAGIIFFIKLKVFLLAQISFLLRKPLKSIISNIFELTTGCQLHLLFCITF